MPFLSGLGVAIGIGIDLFFSLSPCLLATANFSLFDFFLLNFDLSLVPAVLPTTY